VAYDLLLKSGHVLDPAQGVDTVLDIAVEDGTIVAIEPDIPAGTATRVLDVSGPGRHVVPGLLDIHTHVAHGGTTRGVGMPCCVPDEIGVQSGVTTVLDAGSVGIANMGVFPEHILSRAQTRVICFVNVGTFAHTTSNHNDVNGAADIDLDGIASCVEANPGLVNGIKLRLVGPYVRQAGEQVIEASKKAARAAGVPLMVHIGDLFAPDDEEVATRMLELTEHLLGELDAGDILTHLCTPNPGGVGPTTERLGPILTAARERGVVLDSALGMGNFGYRVAAAQYEQGLHPDTISSDLTAGGQVFHSLMECMAKFMAVGYSLEDVVRMTTGNAAAAIGHADTMGALAVGREADITVLDVVEGEFVFTDTRRETFAGSWGIVPVQTVRAGTLHAPRWGTHPWGWLPETEGAR
jgi:dihydroorotase